MLPPAPEGTRANKEAPEGTRANKEAPEGTRAKTKCRARLSALLVACIVLITSFATSVSATVMLYLDLGDLVEISDVIVAGRIVDQTTFYDKEKQQVATISTVKVTKRYFGEVGDTVQFRQWGGSYDGKISQIPGDAEFEPYEESVLFLVDGKGKFAGMRYLAALGQSKYRIVRDGGAPFVFRDLHDLAFLNQQTKEIGHHPSQRFALSSFEPELRALIAGIKGGDQ